MASFNYYLKDGKSRTSTPIYLLFDDSVNRCKLYVHQSIHPKDWNTEKQEARKSLQGFSDFNSKLKKCLAKCEEIHTSLTKEGKFTVELLKQQFKAYLDELNNRKRESNKGASKSFENLYDFGKFFLENVNTSVEGRMKRPATNSNYLQTLRLLKEFEEKKRRKITFERVTLDFYHDFVEYLTKEKQFATNTIGKHIKRLKMFLNEATERGINTKFDYKSRRFKVPIETVETIYLTEDELLQIYKHDFSYNRRLEQTRDLFLIGCYTGLRFSDFSQLTTDNINNEEIRVTTQKTGERVVIPIHWTVRNILDKYASTAKGLPRPISNQKMNEYLKEIGRIAGLNSSVIATKTKGGLRTSQTVSKCDLITTHTARRSFATNLYLSGFPSISIMKITGHSTEKSFMRYIRVSQEENATMLREHWRLTHKLKAV